MLGLNTSKALVTNQQTKLTEIMVLSLFCANLNVYYVGVAYIAGTCLSGHLYFEYLILF